MKYGPKKNNLGKLALKITNTQLMGKSKGSKSGSMKDKKPIHSDDYLEERRPLIYDTTSAGSSDDALTPSDPVAAIDVVDIPVESEALNLSSSDEILEHSVLAKEKSSEDIESSSPIVEASCVSLPLAETHSETTCTETLVDIAEPTLTDVSITPITQIEEKPDPVVETPIINTPSTISTTSIDKEADNKMVDAKEELLMSRTIDSKAYIPKEVPNYFKGQQKTKRVDLPDIKQSRSRNKKKLQSNLEPSFRGQKHNRKHSNVKENKAAPSLPSEISTHVPVPIRDLASMLKRSASVVLSFFTKNIDSTADENTTIKDKGDVELICEHFDCAVKFLSSDPETQKFLIQSDNNVTCPPVVSFMGHVDHGKTTMIDWFRKSRLTSKEAGNITQQVSAFFLSTKYGDLTVLDTPGHEAFSDIRHRSSLSSDIVVIVVDGKEGVKTQTQEAVHKAKHNAKGIIVAITKSDLPDFDQEKIFRQMSELNVIPEAWGGDTVMIPCSSITGDNMDLLLENIVLLGEILEIQADPNGNCFSTVVDSKMDPKSGIIVSLIVKNGTLSVGDWACYKDFMFKIRTMKNDKGETVSHTTPNVPVQAVGFPSHPSAGDRIFSAKNKNTLTNISAELTASMEQKDNVPSMSIEDMFAAKKPTLKLLVKADTQGALDGLVHLLNDVNKEKVDVNIVHTGLGPVSESDIDLAKTGNVIILTFNSKVTGIIAKYAKANSVQIIQHQIIYNILDDVIALMQAMLNPIIREEHVGTLKVLVVFKSSKIGCIAGCSVASGFINKKHKVQIYRKGQQIWEGPIDSMKIRTDDVKSAKRGDECGLVLNGFSAFEVDDEIRAIASSNETQYI